jgi:hypothetical protein
MTHFLGLLSLRVYRSIHYRMHCYPRVIPVGIPTSCHFTHRYREDFFAPVNSTGIKTRFQ